MYIYAFYVFPHHGYVLQNSLCGFFVCSRIIYELSRIFILIMMVRSQVLFECKEYRDRWNSVVEYSIQGLCFESCCHSILIVFKRFPPAVSKKHVVHITRSSHQLVFTVDEAYYPLLSYMAHWEIQWKFQWKFHYYYCHLFIYGSDVYNCLFLSHNVMSSPSKNS